MSKYTIDRPSWQSLVRLSEEDLSRHDLAAVNLACAEDLPGKDVIDVVAQRAWCWEEEGNWRRCLEAWAWSVSLNPPNRLAKSSYLRALKLWDGVQRSRMPGQFPRVLGRGDERRYPELPMNVERELPTFVATENLLGDPELDTKFWSRMRLGDFREIPVAALATFRVNSMCNIQLQFT